MYLVIEFFFSTATPHLCRDQCGKYKQFEMISQTSSLASAYRKLISWLVRIPFTRLKVFADFREEINNEMKSFLRLFRKQNRCQGLQISSGRHGEEMGAKLAKMRESCARMLHFCDTNSEKENGKISVAYSCCFLEKVVIRRRLVGQVLGLKLTTLSEGICTVAEIVREVREQMISFEFLWVFGFGFGIWFFGFFGFGFDFLGFLSLGVVFVFLGLGFSLVYVFLFFFGFYGFLGLVTKPKNPNTKLWYLFFLGFWV
jgi:hypothetical protein